MRFLTDQDVPEDISRVLSQAGHEVTRLRDTLPPTTPDPEVFRYACQHELIMMTCNRDDFLRLAKDTTHPGLIIVIRRKTRQAECAHVLNLLRQSGKAGIEGNINFA